MTIYVKVVDQFVKTIADTVLAFKKAGLAFEQTSKVFGPLEVHLRKLQDEWVADQLISEGWTPWVARFKARWFLTQQEKDWFTGIWLQQNDLPDLENRKERRSDGQVL